MPWGSAWAAFGALSFASEFQHGQPKWWLLGVLSAAWVAVCFKQLLDLMRLKAGSSNERQMIALNFGAGALVALLIAGAAYFYSAAYTMHLLGLYFIP